MANDGTHNGPIGPGSHFGIEPRLLGCSTWDELSEDDDGERPNAWNAPTSSNAPKPTKKAKTMASGNGPATVLSEVANALNPGAEVVLRMNANAKAK